MSKTLSLIQKVQSFRKEILELRQEIESLKTSIKNNQARLRTLEKASEEE